MLAARVQAYLPHQTRDVLTELTKYCTTGIITGRSIDKVAKFVKVDTLFYAGSHGFDIRGPSSTDISHQVCVRFLSLCACFFALFRHGT
jgi:trehalose 6-phosphate phosphatase